MVRIYLALAVLLFSGYSTAEYASQGEHKTEQINGLLTFPGADSELLEYYEADRGTRFEINYSLDINPPLTSHAIDTTLKLS